MKIELNSAEVEKIVIDHFRKMLPSEITEGNEITVRSASYAGLGADVSILPKEKDDD